MNRDPENQQQPVVLEGEVIEPASGARRTHRGRVHVEVVNIGWFGKIVAILAMLALFAAVVVLAAGALLILLPIALLGAIWTWFRLRKLKS